MTFITLDTFYFIAGILLLFVAGGIAVDRGHPRRVGSALFWGLLAAIFLLGGVISPLFVGYMVLTMVVLAVAGQTRAGPTRQTTPAERGGPAAYWSTLPIKAIVAALQARNIPAAVSQTAGTFVCNHVFYGLMHALKTRRGVRGGFVHVPFLPGQAKQGQPSLPLETMIEALARTIKVSLPTRRDARRAGGQLN